MSATQSEGEHRHEVRIHIDEAPYHSPNPTTADALYALGEVPPELELFREVEGDREDPPVPRGTEHIHLTEDEHFHSGRPREITIVVNGRRKEVTARKLSFEQLVALAFDPVPPNAFFTVTYRRGKDGKEGSLQPGQRIRIREGMIFDVTETGQS